MTEIETSPSLPAESPYRVEGEFVLLGFPDLNGSIRGKVLPPAAFEAALRDGAVLSDHLLTLDPTDVPITDYEKFGIRSGAGDMLVRPEPDSLRELSWRPGWRLCLGTPTWRDGSPCELSAREALRTVLNGMAELGYDVLAAFEYEIRFSDRDGRWLSSGISYSLAEVARFDDFVEALRPALDGLGVELVAVHSEAGPGLLELNVAARWGLQAADEATFVKLAVKEVAASMGLRASFLAKTEPGGRGRAGTCTYPAGATGPTRLPASPPTNIRPCCPGRWPAFSSTFPPPRCSSTPPSTPTSASCPATASRST